MTNPFRAVAWWVKDYAYAVLWQCRAHLDRTDPASFRTGSGTPIVVLPGVYESWRFLLPLITAVHARGHPVHVIEELGRNTSSVTDAATRVGAYLEIAGLEDVVVVAHSKGGLIGKQVMASAVGLQRVRSMVAISTPFGGSRYARAMVIPTLRAFSPRDRTILSLLADTTADGRIVSVYPEFDPHIPEGSELLGAKNVRLDTGGHFRVLAHPRVLGEVIAAAE